MIPHRRLGTVAALGAAVLALAAGAGAHEKKTIGPLTLVIGWGDEPVFSGLKNSVDVTASDAVGAPVVDPEGSLSVEIAFGTERLTLPLLPARQPGLFRASILPNRPGTYTFRVTGRLKGQAIDTMSTCSPTTFDCVGDLSAIQFPAKDPSAGELSDRVGRAIPRAERAAAAADGARTLAIAALAAAALAVAAVIGSTVRKGRKDL